MIKVEDIYQFVTIFFHICLNKIAATVLRVQLTRICTARKVIHDLQDKFMDYGRKKLKSNIINTKHSYYAISFCVKNAILSFRRFVIQKMEF